MSDPVRTINDRASSPGQWARDIAATYRDIAETEAWEPRRTANIAEARKYEGIANHMDRVASAGGGEA